MHRLQAKDLANYIHDSLRFMHNEAEQTAEMMVTWPEFGKIHPCPSRKRGYQVMFEQLEF